eukprot:1161301-Pelagomonas_calceolata.AAC.21
MAYTDGLRSWLYLRYRWLAQMTKRDLYKGLMACTDGSHDWLNTRDRVQGHLAQSQARWNQDAKQKAASTLKSTPIRPDNTRRTVSFQDKGQHNGHACTPTSPLARLLASAPVSRSCAWP